jgi:tetratricopeptide (TPR) repeat protein
MLRRELGNKRGIASSLLNLGHIAQDQADYALARSLHEESLAIRRELGDKGGIADSLHNLGTVVREQGDHALARSLLKESLVISKESGHKANIACSLESLASLAAVSGRLDRAAQLWGAAEALREAIGAPLPPHHRSRYERGVDAVRAQLGEAVFMAAKEHRVITMEEITGS